MGIQGLAFNTPYLTVERYSGGSFVLMDAFPIRTPITPSANSDLQSLNVQDAPYRAFVGMQTGQSLTVNDYSAVPSSNITGWVATPGITYSNGVIASTVSDAVIRAIDPWMDADLTFTWQSGNVDVFLSSSPIPNVSISGGVLTWYDATSSFNPSVALTQTLSLNAGDVLNLNIIGNAGAYTGTRTSSVTLDHTRDGTTTRFSMGYLPDPDETTLRARSPILLAGPGLDLCNVSWTPDGVFPVTWTQSVYPPWRVADNWARHVTDQTSSVIEETLLTSAKLYSNVSVTWTANVPEGSYLNVGVGSVVPTQAQFSAPGAGTLYDRWAFTSSLSFLQAANGSYTSNMYTSDVTVFGLTLSGGTATFTSNGTTVLSRAVTQSPPYQIYLGTPYPDVTVRRINVSGTVVPPAWDSFGTWTLTPTGSLATSTGSGDTANPPRVFSTSSGTQPLGFSAIVNSLIPDPETSNVMALTTNSNGTGDYYTSVTFSNGQALFPGTPPIMLQLQGSDPFTVTVSNGVVRWYSNYTEVYSNNAGAPPGPLYAVVTGQNPGDSYSSLVFPSASTPAVPYWIPPKELDNWIITSDTVELRRRIPNPSTLTTTATLTTGQVSWSQTSSNEFDPARAGFVENGTEAFAASFSLSVSSNVNTLYRTPTLRLWALDGILMQSQTAFETPSASFFLTSTDPGDIFYNISLTSTIPTQWCNATGWTRGTDLTLRYDSNVASTIVASNAGAYGTMLVDFNDMPSNTWIGLARTDVSGGDPTADRMSLQYTGGGKFNVPPNYSTFVGLTSPLRIDWGVDSFFVYGANSEIDYITGKLTPAFAGPLAVSNGAAYTSTLRPYIRASNAFSGSNTVFLGSNFDPKWYVEAGDPTWTHTTSGTVTFQNDTSGGTYRTQYTLSGGCRLRWTTGSVNPGYRVQLFTDLCGSVVADYGPSGWSVNGGTLATGSNLEIVASSGSWRFLDGATVVSSGSLTGTGLYASLQSPTGSNTLSNVQFLSVADPEWNIQQGGTWTLEEGTVDFSNANGDLGRIQSVALKQLPATLTVWVTNASLSLSNPSGYLKIGLEGTTGLPYFWSTQLSNAGDVDATFTVNNEPFFQNGGTPVSRVNGSYTVVLTSSNFGGTFRDSDGDTFTVSESWTPPPEFQGRAYFEVGGLTQFSASYTFT